MILIVILSIVLVITVVVLGVSLCAAAARADEASWAPTGYTYVADAVAPEFRARRQPQA
jgi:hypothetical protein